MDEDDSPFSITVTDRWHAHAVPAESLQGAVERTLRNAGCAEARVTIVLVGDAEIAELNEQYLGHKGPTDCITFPMHDGDDDGIDGEIVVSVETAARQARARGIDLDAEILLYTIHGTLHLLGMDDDTEEGADRMHALEDRLLGEMGIGPVFAVEPKP